MCVCVCVCCFWTPFAVCSCNKLSGEERQLALRASDLKAGETADGGVSVDTGADPGISTRGGSRIWSRLKGQGSRISIGCLTQWGTPTSILKNVKENVFFLRFAPAAHCVSV